jgi:dihydrofolate synthase/folylpolyglutamate synthase
LIDNLLGNPHKKFVSIHVAGTNGKGSTSHFLASILQEAGYKVGLYTSPHLKDFRERIKINGKKISKKYVVDFVAEHKNSFEKIQPSFFEMTVGLAFQYFADKKVDYAIIETGLGGRLDSTNIVSPILSVITNISLDHQNLLGPTLQHIAKEKAGIIKQSTPVVIGETQSEVKAIFDSVSKAHKSQIYFADKKYKAIDVKYLSDKKLQLVLSIKKDKQIFIENIKSELLGLYQQKNIPTVLQAVEILQESGIKISKQNCKNGIAKVIENTGLLGRWQVLQNKPLVIADIGHNEGGIKEVLQQIKKTKHQHLHFVMGVVSDKDIEKIMKLLPKKASYYFCKPNIPRGLDSATLTEKAKLSGINGVDCKTVKKAITTAKNQANKNDLIFIGGSAFVVAEAI